MTLDNFENYFTDNRLKNGLSYLKKGKVTELEEDDEGDWYATVQGTEEYDVEIILGGKKIASTDCSCVSFEIDGQCKHVAAVLYAIIAKKKLANEQKVTASHTEIKEAAAKVGGNKATPVNNPENKTTIKKSDKLPDDIIAKIDEMRPEELRVFLKVYLPGHEELISSLVTFEAYWSCYRSLDDLEKQLTAEIDPFEKDGSIHQRHIPAILKIADGYLDKTEKHLQNNEAKQALDHALAVLDVIPYEFKSIEDEEASHYRVMRRAFQLIDDICKKGKFTESEHELLCDRVFEGAADINTPFAVYELHWLDIIAKHNLAIEKTDEFISLLDDQLAKHQETQQQDQLKRLLRLKIDFLSQNGMKKESLKLLEANPDIANEKEKLLSSVSRKNGEYKIVKLQLLAELELAKTNGDKEKQNSLQRLIIELLAGTSEVLELRKLAEQFYRETGESFFFEAMKDTYVKADWEQVKGKFANTGNPLRKA